MVFSSEVPRQELGNAEEREGITSWEEEEEDELLPSAANLLLVEGEVELELELGPKKDTRLD
jgi:hypothetical protein